MRRDAKQEPNRSMEKIDVSVRAARRLQDRRHDGGGRMTDAERANVHGRLTTTVEFGKFGKHIAGE